MTAETPEAAAHSWRRRFLLRIGEVRGALLGVIGLATAALTLLFLIFPDWRPAPRDKVRAAISIMALEPKVRLDDWAARQFPGDPDGALARVIGEKHPSHAEKHDVHGEVVYVKLEADGFRGRKVHLRARVYDPATGQALDFDPDDFGGRASSLKINAPSRSSVQLLFLTDLSDEGRLFVRVELYDDDGVLAVADSPVIRDGVAPSSLRPSGMSKASSTGGAPSSAA